MSVITSHQLKKASGRMPNAIHPRKPKTGKDLRTPPSSERNRQMELGRIARAATAARSAISALHMGRFFKKIKRVQ
jgi:hypothetical protein